MYYLHLFSRKQPDLNWDNPRVRKEVFDMMIWWCEKGIDGFRMDVISLISKTPGLPDGTVGKSGYGDFGPYCANGPKVHEYLQEMNREVLSRYDLITVGECSGVTVEEAKKYASLSGKELNMVFQFEHMDLDGGESFKWNHKKIPLTGLKQIMSKWQRELAGKAWNSLYWCNHDQPRMLSRMGNDSPKYREISAKMLGTCLHMLQGTPYIYQGEELGMTNYPFTSLEEFRDIGFTVGTPWIPVNPNYREINAKEQMERADSVFYYYKKLIRLRKEHGIIVYGDYELLLPDSEELYVYLRGYQGEKLLTICNFTEKEITYRLPEELFGLAGEVLVSNYGRVLLDKKILLKPYEAIAVLY